MKTILAAIVSIAFLAPAAMACPHDGAETKTVKKDEKAEGKQAEAKPAPKAPATVKPAPKAAPKAEAGSKSEPAGKVSAK